MVAGSFSKNTYETVSNLPISDYQQFTKRVQELIALSNNFTSQDYNSKTELPGTWKRQYLTVAYGRGNQPNYQF